MTGTQKIIAGIAGIGIVALVLSLAFGNKDDGKKPGGPADPQASSGIVETTSTMTRTPPPTPTAAVTPDAAPVASSGKPVDVATLALEAKRVAAARELLAKGDAKGALAEIERYESIPDRGSLTPEATLVKIEALTKVNRRTDALALAMSTRDNPKMAPYQPRVEALIQDAGLIGPTPPPIPTR